MNVAEVLEQVRQQYGSLTWANLLESQTPEDAPLHDRYCWDESKAAHAYRLIQSGQIIRSVKVQRIGADEIPVRDLRAYYHVPRNADDDEAHGEFVPLVETLRDPRMSAVVEGQMRRDIAIVTRRWSTFAEYRDALAAELERLAS